MKYYVIIKTFALPPSDTSWSFDAFQNDGRLLLVNGKEIYIETAAWAHTFKSVAVLATDAPGAMRISPDGKKSLSIASNGKSMTLFDPTNGNIFARFPTEDQVFFFDAEWFDNNHFAVTAATLDSPLIRYYDARTQEFKVIVRNIGAASGGVTFADDDSLYVGNGFDAENADNTGLIKAYDKAAWQNALSENKPIDFESPLGRPVANLLSAAYLGFDYFGNFTIGGGDQLSKAPDVNYAAIIFNKTLKSTIGGGLANGLIQKLDPDTRANAAWIPNDNRASRELILSSYEDQKNGHICLLAYDHFENGFRNLLLQTNFHLGDTPGAYQFPVAFVGMTLQLPLPLPTLESFQGNFELILVARDVQTWGDSKGHKVTLNDVELKPLKDQLDQNQPDRYCATVKRADYAAIYATQNPAILKIEVEDVGQGMADDFLLTAYGYRIKEI